MVAGRIDLAASELFDAMHVQLVGEDVRLSAEGATGAKTVFDIAPTYLSPLDGAYLREHML